MIKHSLIEHEHSFHENHWAVRIDEGKYEGVVYQYDTVSFNEEEGDMILSFNTVTLDNPSDIPLTGSDFETILGDILTEIIEQQLEQMDEDGTGDTTTPDQQ